MDWLRKASTPIKQLYLTATLVMFAMLTACGSGGFDEDTGPTGDSGTGGSQEPTITISLSLVSSVTDQPTQTITSSNPGRVVATVTGITQPVIVTFSTDVAAIPIPTAITDGSNQATVDILAGSTLGAGTILASVDTGESASLVYAVGATNLQMGSGSPFQEGVAETGAAQISAGGTTTISVNIVDESGQPFTDPVDVNFSSACSSAVPATASISSPITTVNGTASTTYLAQGCVGDDAINVTANAGGINLSATGSVNVLPADVGSIEFVSATPENIVIQGAGGIGGSENSTIIFRVRDTNGNPVNGQDVDFSLNTNVGGIEMNPLTATTDASGLAQTVVNSGTVSASVRITATIAGSDPAISTQSSNLVVSTGIPDQDSFTVAATTFNVEGWDIAGVTTQIEAFLADGFNNPVPDGTTVSFQTEGGRVAPSCTTSNGRCVVEWNSQNPRPIGNIHPPSAIGGVIYYPDRDGNNGPSTNNNERLSDGSLNPLSLGQPYGGRATVTVTAIGEESFPDSNGNGRFDASEVDAFLGNNGFSGLDIGGRPFDLSEAYTDYNEDGFFNPVDDDPNEQEGGDLEEQVDFSNLGVYDLADSLYNGVLCAIPAHAGCSTTQQSLHVREDTVIVLSGSTPYVRIVQTADNDPTATTSATDDVLHLQTEAQGIVTIVVSDLHNQPLPAGTTISFETTYGSIKGTTSFIYPNTNRNGGHGFSASVEAETEPGSGTVNVKFTLPSGLEFVYGLVSVIGA